MEFIRGLIRWIIIALIIFIIIILIGHFASKQSPKPVKNASEGLKTIKNEVEDDFEDGLEIIDQTVDNTIQENNNLPETTQTQTIENAPDTSSSGKIQIFFGIIILSSGGYYIYKRRCLN